VRSPFNKGIKNNANVMLETARCFLMITLFAAISHTGFCEPSDSLVVNLAFKNKEIMQPGDLKMTLTIRSFMKQTVYVPAVDLWGLPSSVDGFYIIEIQKRLGKNYGDLHIRGAIDNMPSFNTDRLHFGDKKELAFPINTLSQFTKGEYRVRVQCKFSALNKLRNRYSNWAYFTCNRDIPPK
jgi:hypothetical protein